MNCTAVKLGGYISFVLIDDRLSSVGTHPYTSVIAKIDASLHFRIEGDIVLIHVHVARKECPAQTLETTFKTRNSTGDNPAAIERICSDIKIIPGLAICKILSGHNSRSRP